MPISKTELLLKKFEENVFLEKFSLDHDDKPSLLKLLDQQADIIPELVRLLENEPRDGANWARLRRAADARAEQERRVAAAFVELRKELDRIQKSTRRVQDLRKAWVHPADSGNRLPNTYA